MRRCFEKLPVFAVILALALSGLACKLPLVTRDQATPVAAVVEAPPRAWFDAPAHGASLPLAPVAVKYRAGGPAGFTQVELSINGEVASIDASLDPSATEAAFEYTWQPPAPGSYILAVRAQGKNGGWSDLARVNVQVIEDTPAPENPAIIEAQPTAEAPSPTPTLTLTPEPTSTSEPTETSQPSVTPTSSEITFEVELSTDKAYSGACTPNEVEFTVTVSDPARVRSIVVFFKLENLANGEKTAWDDGTAFNPATGGPPGRFERKMATSAILGGAFGSYRVLYQVIATGPDNKVVQRSSTYTDLTIEKCP